MEHRWVEPGKCLAPGKLVRQVRVRQRPAGDGEDVGMALGQDHGGLVNVVHASVGDDWDLSNFTRQRGDRLSAVQSRGLDPVPALACHVQIVGSGRGQLTEDGLGVPCATGPAVLDVVDLRLRQPDTDEKGGWDGIVDRGDYFGG